MNLSVLSHGRFSLDPDLHQTYRADTILKSQHMFPSLSFLCAQLVSYVLYVVGVFDNLLSIFACLQCIPNNFRPLGFRMAYLHFVVVNGSGQN